MAIICGWCFRVLSYDDSPEKLRANGLCAVCEEKYFNTPKEELIKNQQENEDEE
jgi:hypothetical protein